MRLKMYKNIDEAIKEFVPVFMNHKGSIPLEWGYSKSVALQLYARDYIDKINLAIDCFDDKKLSELEINSSQFAKTAFRYSVTSKSVNIDREIVANKFLALFNLGVKKQIDLDKEYESKKKTIDLISCMDDVKIKIAYINANIRALCELMYCDEHTIGGQISGPYKIDNLSMLIHDYSRLRPIELHAILDSFKIKKIVSYCTYDDDSIDIDLIGNVSHSGNVLQTICTYCLQVVTIDDKVYYVRPDELNGLIEYLDKWIIIFLENYRKKNEFNRWKLALECEYYAVKPLFEQVHIGWSPLDTDTAYDLFPRAKEGYYSSVRKKTHDLKESEDLYNFAYNLIDPRII
ncbi:MAG: hypothetical protein HFG38_07960 [Eubacterium sp.]|nr:hypothetical protein [Eubacterium sp.]